MEKSELPVSVRAGKMEFLRTNSRGGEWRDMYRMVLSLSWPMFGLVVLAVYLGLNLIFATAYLLGENCIAEMAPGSFSSAFFFSVQTLSTVGFGYLHPATLYGDVVTTVEIVVGMFYTAVVTGLIFVRFSRPMARLLFSKAMVISNFNGMPALQFRVANQQRQAMVEAEFRLMMVRREWIEEEDDDIRRFYSLKLDFERLVIFPSALIIRHIIDENSPLFGVTPEKLEEWSVRFMTSIVCIDTVIQSPVQSQYDYIAKDVRFGHRFVEIYTEREDGRMEVDYGRVHETEPVPDRA
ncbi:MAG: ATP-sensitive inward rectifier potassium channel 10 [Gloeobacteraceae cyanobacterium ES-bin-144]|nr:ATP-sensitive inward rectifier potassium channel 10 [Verrucomicrobiales bacterium]